MSAWGERVSRVVDGSAVGTILDSLGGSHLLSGVETIGSKAARVVRRSFLFHWLTKEPEPQVIVIDLRETRTVEPIIRLLDWTIARIRPYWEETALKRGLEDLGALGEQATETRVGIVCVRLLTPPEPSEGERDEGS
jgi:hypothetical protein